VEPRGGFGRAAVARHLAAALAVVGLLSVAASAVMVVRSDPAQTVAKVGWTTHTQAGLALEIPRLWIEDEYPRIGHDIVAAEPGAEDKLLDEIFTEIDRDEGRSRRAPPVFEVPAWKGAERVVTVRGFGATIDMRAAVFVQRQGDRIVALQVLLPERHARPLAADVERMVASAKIVTTPDAATP
jgi:hypothetical protein